MRRFVFLSLLCIFFTNAMYAQTDIRRISKGVEDAAEKALREYEAKQKKAAEEAKRKEREKAQRHEQQRRQHEVQFNRQMNNLNSVSVEDYMTGPKQQAEGKGFQPTTYKAEGNQTAPVATPRKNLNNRQMSNNNGSNRSRNTGALINSGGNYTGDRYNIKPAGYGINQQNRQQTRVSANQIRGKYKPNRTMNQGIVNISRANIRPKTSVLRPQQQNNIKNEGKAQTQKTLAQPKNEQNTNNMQIQQKPVQKKVWMENGKLVLDPSQGSIQSSLQESNSSPDLKNVDITKPKYATNVKKITAYDIPHEAYSLSDRNKKIISANVRPRTNNTRTEASQYQKMRQDAMDGFSSFDNRQKWEDIYGYEYYKTVKTSRTVTKKRN